MGLGSYRDEEKFGDRVGDFTIGKPTTTIIPLTVGPGEYNPSSKQTKPRTYQASMPLHVPPHPETSQIGPNSYPSHVKFGENVPTFTIGVK